MKTWINRTAVLVLISAIAACGDAPVPEAKTESDFKYFSEQFSDLKVIRYTITGFEELSLQEKELCTMWSRYDLRSAI